jgi:hypothetical protein
MALPRDIANSGDRPRSIGDQQEQSPLGLAWGHAMVRNGLIAKVLCYLSVMRASGLIPADSRALVSPKSIRLPQDFQSSGGNQAAHYLPGFVAIQPPSPSSAKALWALVENKRVQGEIEGLFRQTQDLHASFNRADSAAEAKRWLGPSGLDPFRNSSIRRAFYVDTPM